MPARSPQPVESKCVETAGPSRAVLAANLGQEKRWRYGHDRIRRPRCHPQARQALE
jgi:hypothetical protein